MLVNDQVFAWVLGTEDFEYEGYVIKLEQTEGKSVLFFLNLE